MRHFDDATQNITLFTVISLHVRPWTKKIVASVVVQAQSGLVVC